jgi:hypothetical protein
MADIPHNELDALRQRADAADSAIAASQQAAARADAAVEAARTFARAANSDLPEQAFAGDTIEDLQRSIDGARAVADHVRAQTPAPATPPPPPATPPAASEEGAPPPAARNPHDLIRAGLLARQKS